MIVNDLAKLYKIAFNNNIVLNFERRQLKFYKFYLKDSNIPVKWFKYMRCKVNNWNYTHDVPDKIKNNTILNQMITNQKIKLGVSGMKKFSYKVKD